MGAIMSETHENFTKNSGVDDGQVRPVLVVLQNAWAYQPERVARNGEWPYESWVWALQYSRTGQRLCRIFDTQDKWDSAHFCNTTPMVGDCSGSKLPPNAEYVLGKIEKVRPRLVVACGKQAEALLTKEWSGPLLCIPHPTCRIVTNQLLFDAKDLVESGWKGRMKLIQRRGAVEKVEVAIVPIGERLVEADPNGGV